MTRDRQEKRGAFRNRRSVVENTLEIERGQDGSWLLEGTVRMDRRCSRG
jgi:hypothetical protein